MKELNDEEKELVIKMYLEGVKQKDISKYFRCRTSTVT